MLGPEKQHNYFICIFFSMYKMKPKVLSYDEICINKNVFHKTTSSINIDEVAIDKITLLDITSYGNKGSFKYHI